MWTVDSKLTSQIFLIRPKICQIVAILLLMSFWVFSTIMFLHQTKSDGRVFFRIKEDVSDRWGYSSHPPSCVGLNVMVLFIYLFILFILYYLNTPWPFGLTLTFGQRAFSGFPIFLEWPMGQLSLKTLTSHKGMTIKLTHLPTLP